jgi:hypothetical protein
MRRTWPTSRSFGSFRAIDTYNFLTLSLDCRIERLRPSGAKPGVKVEVCEMADVVYIGIGILFFVLMGLYAVACERL